MTDQLSVDDRAAIEAIIASQELAWNRGDAEPYGERALPGIVFTNVVGGYYVGRDALLALWPVSLPACTAAARYDSRSWP